MSTILPHRRVRVTVEDKEQGDIAFARKMHEAMAEMAEHDPSGSCLSFKASNGLEITIEPEQMLDTWWELFTRPFRFRWRRSWGLGIFGGRK